MGQEGSTWARGDRGESQACYGFVNDMLAFWRIISARTKHQHLRRPLKFPPSPSPTKSMIEKEDLSSVIFSITLQFHVFKPINYEHYDGFFSCVMHLLQGRMA